MAVDRLVPLAFLFLCVAAATQAAGVYKWVDEDGVVHYDQQPPRGTDATQMSISKPHISSEQSNAELEALKTKAGLVPEDAEAVDMNEEAARIRAEMEAARKENCEIARSNLTQLMDKRRMITVDDEGFRYYHGEEERQAKMAEFRADIKEYCY
jgi:hypothetical protein